MNFEAVLHYKHQNQGRDEKKKLRHASGASANSEASNSDSEVDSTDPSPVPSPGQKKVNEVSYGNNTEHSVCKESKFSFMILNIPDLVCKPLYTYFHQMFKTAHQSEISLHILAQKAYFLGIFVSYTKSSQKPKMIFLLHSVYTELCKNLFSFPISFSKLSTGVALHILACPQRDIIYSSVCAESFNVSLSSKTH